MSFKNGFEKKAGLIGTAAGLVARGVGAAAGAVARGAGKAVGGVGKAVIKSQGGGLTGAVNTGLTGLGAVSQGNDVYGKLTRAAQR